MTVRPTATVVVPAWNEETDIAGCLEAIAAQTHSSEDLEVILVDGGSTDRTVERACAVMETGGFGRALVLDNPARRTSTSLNVGLEAATAPVLIRVDARSRIGSDHIRQAVALLAERPDVGVVGGAQVATPRGRGAVAGGIARALNNRWTTGLARYRRTRVAGPADTVWMGAFRTTELRAVGGWDATVALNEDWDLNQRYRRSGRLVWFHPALSADYVPRPSLAALARQYFCFGRVKGTLWARGRRPSRRQVALVGAPLVAAAAGVSALRRLGPAVVVTVLVAGLAAVDLTGHPGRHHVAIGARCVALAASGITCASWWVGMIVGAVGEQAGIEHRHS